MNNDNALNLSIGGNTGTVAAPTQTIMQTATSGTIDLTPTSTPDAIVPAPATTLTIATPNFVTRGAPAVFDSRPSGNGPLVSGSPQTITIGGATGSGVPADAKAVIVGLTAVHVAGGKGSATWLPTRVARPSRTSATSTTSDRTPMWRTWRSSRSAPAAR